MHGCTTTTFLDPFFLMERSSNIMSSSLRKQQRRDDEEEEEDDDEDPIDTPPPPTAAAAATTTTKKTNNSNSVSGSRSRSCSSISEDDISFSDLSTKDDDTSSRMSLRRERRVDGGGTVKSFDSLMDRTSSSLDKSILSSNSGINNNNESSDEDDEDFGPVPGGWSNYIDETGEDDRPKKELDDQQDDHDDIGDNDDEPYFESLKGTDTSSARNEGTKSLHDSCPVNFLGETNDFQEEKKQQQQDGGLSISSHGYTNIRQLSSPIGVILHSPKSGPSTKQYRKGQQLLSPKIQERMEILKSRQRSQSPRPIRVPMNTSPKAAQRRKAFNPKVGISSSSAHSRMTSSSSVGLGSSSAHGVMIRNNNSSLANKLEQNHTMKRKGFDRSSCSLDGLPFSRQQRDHTTTKASTHHRYQNSHETNDLGDSKTSFFSFSSGDNMSLTSDMERRHRPKQQQQQQQQQLEYFSDDDFEQADKHRFDENDDDDEEGSTDLSGIVARGGRDAVSGGDSDGERRRDSWGQMVNSLKSPPQKSPRSTAGVNRTDDNGAAASSSAAFPAPPFWIDNDDDESDRNHDMVQNPPSFRRHRSAPVPSSWMQGSHGGHQKEALEADPFLAEDNEDQETVENLKLKIQELERKLESSGRTGEMDLNDCTTSNRPSSREKELTELLNAKDKRIKELEEQLARANANAHPTEYFGGNDSFFNLPSMSCSSDDNDEDSDTGRKERGRKVKRRGSTGVMSDKRQLLRDGGKRSGTPIRPRSAGSMGQLSDAKSSRRSVGGLKENGTSIRPRRAGSLGQLADAKSSRRSVGGLKENGTPIRPRRADSLGQLADAKSSRRSVGSLKEKEKPKNERQIGSDDNDDDKKADKKMKRRGSTGAMDDKIKTKRKASTDRKQCSKEKRPDAEGGIGTMDLADDSSKSSKKSTKRSSSANSLARKKREKARGRSPSSKSLRQSRTIQMPMDEYEKGMKRTNSNNSLKGVPRTSSHSSQTSKKKQERRSQSPRSLSQRLGRTIGLAIDNDDDDNQSNASSKSNRRRSSKGGLGLFKKSDKSKIDDASASSVGSSSHKSSKSAKTTKTDLSTFLNNRDDEAAIRVTRRSKKPESDSICSSPEKSGKKVKKSNKKVGDDNVSISGGSVTGQKRKKKLGGIKKWSPAMDFDLMKAGSSPKPQKKDP